MNRFGIIKAAMLMVAIFTTAGLFAQNVNARFMPDKGVATTDNAVFHFKNLSEGAMQYRWLTGDGAIVDNTDDLSWEFSDMGIYNVGLIAYRDAQADTTFVRVAVLRGENNGNEILDPTKNMPIPALSYSEDEK